MGYVTIGYYPDGHSIELCDSEHYDFARAMARQWIREQTVIHPLRMDKISAVTYYRKPLRTYEWDNKKLQVVSHSGA